MHRHLLRTEEREHRAHGPVVEQQAWPLVLVQLSPRLGSGLFGGDPFAEQPLVHGKQQIHRITWRIRLPRLDCDVFVTTYSVWRKHELLGHNRCCLYTSSVFYK